MENFFCMTRYCERAAGMKTECHHFSFVSTFVGTALIYMVLITFRVSYHTSFWIISSFEAEVSCLLREKGKKKEVLNTLQNDQGRGACSHK